MVRSRFAWPLGACGEAGAGPCASRWPHVTQNRIPTLFALPQSGHVMRDASGACDAAAGACGAGGGREGGLGAKLTTGAGGRWRAFCADRAAACALGGASAVWARGDGAESAAGGTIPTGGVGGATRGASR
jgi:hypothetical protein